MRERIKIEYTTFGPGSHLVDQIHEVIAKYAKQKVEIEYAFGLVRQHSDGKIDIDSVDCCRVTVELTEDHTFFKQVSAVKDYRPNSALNLSRGGETLAMADYRDGLETCIEYARMRAERDARLAIHQSTIECLQGNRWGGQEPKSIFWVRGSSSKETVKLSDLSGALVDTMERYSPPKTPKPPVAEPSMPLADLVSSLFG